MTRPAARRVAATLVALLAIQLAAAPVGAFYTVSNSDLTVIELEPSSSPQVRDELITYVYNRTDGLNLSDGSDVHSAVLDIKDSMNENVTAITNALDATGNMSDVVHAARDEAMGDGLTWSGTRTNLSIARGSDNLYMATVALYEELGQPLTQEEKDALKAEVILLPSAAQTAGALAIFATIDAMHYVDAAFAGLDEGAWRDVRGNQTFLSLTPRRADVTTTEGSTTVSLGSNTTRAVDAATNASDSVDRIALMQALDVLAQAADEVNALTFLSGTLSGSDSAPQCTNSTTLLFATDDCLVLIGGEGDTEYYPMEGPGGNDKNIVLIDFGGNDLYTHRAGGGMGAPGCNPFYQPPCNPAVQMNIDLGAGSDRYLLPPGVDGPAHGAGQLGVGLLMDEAGDDRYNVSHPAKGETLLAQGAGNLGAGLLADLGGADDYEASQAVMDATVHAQGVAQVGGFGALFDRAGGDTYAFHVLSDNKGRPVDGGGAQAYANTGGIAYLLDHGTAGDTYEAGQELVQGASTLFGFALLRDASGTNIFELRSTLGCPNLDDNTNCDHVPVTNYNPLAGYAWGYAHTGGMGVLASGTSADHFRIIEFEPDNPAHDRTHEGTNVGGVGSTAGIGVLHDPSGSDDYEAAGSAFGFATDTGSGAFVDTGGNDDYRCAADTCYGAALDARGVYYDGRSRYDTYANGLDPTVTSAWTKGDVGIGSHVTKDSDGGCCCCSGGGDNNVKFQRAYLQ